MRKIFISILIILIFFCYESCWASDTYLNAESFYDEVKKYDESDIIKVINSNDSDYMSDSEYITKKIFKLFFEEISTSWKYIAEIIFVCVISSLLKSFVSKKEICDVGGFSCFCVCVMFILSGFKLVSDICLHAIENINEFMSFSLPVYASVVAEGGFTVTATTMQSIFMFISVIISNFIVKFIYPLLYLCGLLASVNGISSNINLTRFVKLISKVIKYFVGVIMTIFAGIITFAGISSASGDNIAIKTIKFTVSNFVPVVGACLSDALNSFIGSSLVLKNNIGYISFLGLMSVCIVPIIKSAVSILVFRLSASVAELFSETTVSSMIDSVCDIMSTMVSMLVFVVAVFVLIMGIMASTG